MFRRIFGLARSGKQQRQPDNHKYDIDVDCNYCPKCGDEYRAEIGTCPTCSIPLVSGSEKLACLKAQERSPSYSADISADDELAVIKTGKLGYVKPLQQLLKREQIPSILAAETLSKG